METIFLQVIFIGDMNMGQNKTLDIKNFYNLYSNLFITSELKEIKLLFLLITYIYMVHNKYKLNIHASSKYATSMLLCYCKEKAISYKLILMRAKMINFFSICLIIIRDSLQLSAFYTTNRPLPLMQMWY